ncbi:DNA ligase [Enterobacter phage vB_EclM_CIP9]|uniref:DNA ligase n=1 Tax=Enterobacter phage vB_EclM_CIP9 TaxID=2696340 RepID=A0A6B9Y0I9_9CAUD|nr:ATP-dependent DNA ligase [Enterobacter phage vB_EclM_CIP9]QHS01559.1 DNA ligase [Enterobacter phage vB_EclM_CIP9]
MIIDILNELAATDSINEKKAIMEREKGNELLKRVFIMAYSKRFNYGIKKWGTRAKDEIHLTLEDMLYMLEEKLAKRVITGNAAIEKLEIALSQTSEGDAEVIRRVLMRDLECGTGPTIANKIWKNCIPEQPQMLASSYDEKLIEKHIKWPAFAQLKADGARCFAEVTDDGVKFFSRAGNEYKGLRKLAEELMVITEDARKRHPSGVMIDGELVYHAPKVEPKADNDLFGMFEEPEELSKAAEFQNVDRSTSNGLANKSLKGTISQVEASGMKLQAWDYVPLDVVYSEGEKPGFAYDVRFRALETMIAEGVALHGFDSVILIENQWVYSLKEAREVYKKYVDQGLEGIILKNMGSFWENKRSKNLIKFKEVIDIAMEIVGFYPHSKDPNKLGGVELKSLCGKITSDCGSGFKDTTRVKVKGKWVDIPIDERDALDRERLMKEALEGNLVGRIADCECNGWVHSKGRDGTVGIFLPIIKGFRFDKTSADTFEDVFGSWDQTGL